MHCRENLVPQVDELVFDKPMPFDQQKSVPGDASRLPGLSLEKQLSANLLASSMLSANLLAEQRWRAGSRQCLANLNSWPSRLCLAE